MIHSRFRAALVASVLTSAVVIGQNIPTIPYANAVAEGSSIGFAFARPGYQLTQTIYESRFVYRGLQSYSTVLFRPDSGSAVPTMPAVTRHLTIRMSGVGVPSPELASTTSFAANHGSDFATVLNNRAVAFPAVAQRPQPAAFMVTVPLDQPFSTLGIAHLLVEFETQPESGSTTPWYPDAEVFPAADWTVITDVQGANCPANATGFGASFDGSSSALVTTISAARDPNQPPTHPAVAILGSSLTQWGPIPLPFRLDAFGAPGCSVYTDALQSYVGMTGGGSGERFTFRLPVPRNFALLGQQVHSQSFILDPVANAFGIRASAVATFTFSSPPDPRRTMQLSSITPGDRPELVTPNQATIFGVQ